MVIIRRVRMRVAIPLALVAALVLVTVAWTERWFDDDDGRIDCDGYEFDAGSWDEPVGSDEQQEEGIELARCRALLAKTRGEVAALLGEPDLEKPAYWRYFLGEINDEYGPGDGASLFVSFRGSDVVKKVRAP